MAAHGTADYPSPTDLPQAASAWLSPTSGSELCPRIERTGLGQPGAGLSIITRSALLSPPPKAEEAVSGLPGGATNLQQLPYGGVSSARNAQTARWNLGQAVCRAESWPPCLPSPAPGHFQLPPTCHLPHLQFPKDLKKAEQMEFIPILGPPQ